MTLSRSAGVLGAIAMTATMLIPTADAVAEPNDSHLGLSPARALLAADAAGRQPETIRPQVLPRLNVQTVMRRLDHPWDVAFTPRGVMLVTQRERGNILVRRPDGRVRQLVSSVPGLWASGETGLMGIVVDPRFPRNRRFYTCHGHQHNGNHDVRVVAWKANGAITSAQQVRVLVKGIRASSGRHGGCRLRFGPGRYLFVATGDAATTGTARNLRSLGGKVLRVGPGIGRAAPGNPFIRSPYPNKRKIWTYGHRNVQGLARRPGGAMWSVEHGTYRDDEVNRLVKGGDYGWQAGPGYDESPPMTNHSLPGQQIDARWSSGDPTVATSGATWLTARRWAGFRGMLAVAALKDQSLRLMRFDSDGGLVRVRMPPALDGTYGRLRTAQVSPRGALYITTSGGSGSDRVLRVTPQT